MKKSLVFKILYLFLILIVIAGASVFATNTYLASQVTYNNEKNVEEALNELYEKSNNNIKCVKANYIKPENSSVNIELDFTPSFVFMSFYNRYSSQTQYIIYDSQKAINCLISTSNKTISSSQINIDGTNIKYEFDPSGDNYKKNNTFYYIAIK